jgi:hypothetical protein
MRVLVVLFLAFSFVTYGSAQDADTAELCNAGDLTAQVTERISEYEAEVTDAETSDAVIAAAKSLSDDLANIGSECVEAQPAEATQEPSSELVDSKDFDVSSLIEGTRRVTWSNTQNTCTNGAVVPSEDRVFILSVSEDTFAVDDIFIWRPNLTFTRVADGTLLYNRNETNSRGVAYTYEYRIVRASPELLEGVVTNFFPAYDCTLRDTFRFTLEDSTLHCMVGPNTGGNVRAEPSADSGRLRALAAEERTNVISQRRGTDSFMWYELQGGGWVRSDVVLTAGDCESVPVSTP